MDETELENREIRLRWGVGDGINSEFSLEMSWRFSENMDLVPLEDFELKNDHGNSKLWLGFQVKGECAGCALLCGRGY